MTTIPWYFTGIEIGAYALAVLLLWQAGKQGRYMLLTLIMAMLYGYLLEYMDIRDYHAYVYGQFHIMLPGAVPLPVALSWGMIFYAATQTSDKLGLLWTRRPWLDGLLAISIDLCMDPIAAQLGYWEWTPPGPWLGIPFGNFFGWLVVITALSYVWRAASRRFQAITQGLLQQLLILVGVMVVSLLILFVALAVFERLTVTPVLREGWQAVMVLAWIILAAALVAPYYRTFERNNPVEWMLLALPLFFFGYLTLMVFTAVTNPSTALVVNTLLTAVVGLWLFTLPYSSRLFKR
ncbi:MAG: carotenoid biosynthesis protein [Anaerolineae bacterium]|nr:carotenoid biosynthesis protein [Anaerolineae bacterium]